MNATITTNLPSPRNHARSTTPWLIRILLVVSILFGIWVDVSRVNSTFAPEAAADPSQNHLLGMDDAHSAVTDIVRTLASRR